MKYKAILIFGPPGAGKGTQAKLLAQNDPNYFHFSTGDMFRALKTNPEIANSEIGKKINVLDGGSLVSDDLTIELFFKTLGEYEKSGKYNPQRQTLILDGIPRNANQVPLVNPRINVEKIINLYCPDYSALAERLTKRATIEGRVDDANPEIVKKRLETYDRETSAVLSKYPKSIILEINGLDTIENIHKNILARLGS